MEELMLVRIDSDYCDYLRKYDSRVPYNYESKKLRPFTGTILLKLTTPKLPPSILSKSIFDFKPICLGFGLESGAKYIQSLTLNNTPIKGLNFLLS